MLHPNLHASCVRKNKNTSVWYDFWMGKRERFFRFFALYVFSIEFWMIFVVWGERDDANMPAISCIARKVVGYVGKSAILGNILFIFVDYPKIVKSE